ncbi:hypothetical protein SARC_05805 [Sphaeroforma arctica JP610]|uniref:Uncharacterized protein n=1 Tax=Sphaeroforma arctica JP610 TaxID=667725 RepID=A0A0L0FYG6_9EUKA|nr:hypothetical protein SARC_05805 [Sphaeroforma arctica JP610]KNC81892.1 hypothetical protein SARC_05805 [Sphaeroforma arctica JP610]|eukprot:XP_014155794.1 hypothetical protein SARC_05805 [Sphaeroforma arctica JP610]
MADLASAVGQFDSSKNGKTDKPPSELADNTSSARRANADTKVNMNTNTNTKVSTSITKGNTEDAHSDEKDDSTVVVDPLILSEKELMSRHPLQHKWTLWHDEGKGNRAKNTNVWIGSLTKVSEFDTVEMFWATYHNIVPPSRLGGGSNYWLFKSGVQPMWEDPMNEQGGKWSLGIPSSKREEKLNTCWLATMLGLVGETMEDQGEVMGAVVSIRKMTDRLAVWTQWSSKDYEETINRIGERFKSICQTQRPVSVNFKAHNEVYQHHQHLDANAKDGSSTSKNKGSYNGNHNSNSNNNSHNRRTSNADGSWGGTGNNNYSHKSDKSDHSHSGNPRDRNDNKNNNHNNHQRHGSTSSHTNNNYSKQGNVLGSRVSDTAAGSNSSNIFTSKVNTLSRSRTGGSSGSSSTLNRLNLASGASEKSAQTTTVNPPSRGNARAWQTLKNPKPISLAAIQANGAESKSIPAVPVTSAGTSPATRKKTLNATLSRPESQAVNRWAVRRSISTNAVSTQPSLPKT